MSTLVTGELKKRNGYGQEHDAVADMVELNHLDCERAVEHLKGCRMKKVLE